MTSANPGFYAPGPGLAQPLLCPEGSFCPSGSSHYTSCPAGTFQPYRGGLALADCQHCTAGSYSLAGLATAACALCSPGSFQPYTGKSYCQVCPAGSFQPAYGAVSCNSCPGGDGSTGAEGLGSEEECFTTPQQVHVEIRLLVEGVPISQPTERQAFLFLLQAAVIATLQLSKAWHVALVDQGGVASESAARLLEDSDPGGSASALHSSHGELEVRAHYASRDTTARRAAAPAVIRLSVDGMVSATEARRVQTMLASDSFLVQGLALLGFAVSVLRGAAVIAPTNTPSPAATAPSAALSGDSPAVSKSGLPQSTPAPVALIVGILVPLGLVVLAVAYRCRYAQADHCLFSRLKRLGGFTFRTKRKTPEAVAAEKQMEGVDASQTTVQVGSGGHNLKQPQLLTDGRLDHSDDIQASDKGGGPSVSRLFGSHGAGVMGADLDELEASTRDGFSDKLLQPVWCLEPMSPIYELDPHIERVDVDSIMSPATRRHVVLAHTLRELSETTARILHHLPTWVTGGQLPPKKQEQQEAAMAMGASLVYGGASGTGAGDNPERSPQAEKALCGSELEEGTATDLNMDLEQRLMELEPPMPAHLRALYLPK